ncbi:MAG: DNA repair protein RecN [Erysipelotrichaceae bacterium]
MLQSIYVKDFILFDEVILDFKNGMSAFTGETGAGKSLLIDAIAVLMGERIRSDMVKHGCEKATIEGAFSLSKDSITFDLLQAAGYECLDDTLVLTRIISADGKSIAKINQRVTTLSLLKEITQAMVDIHSQHDTQYLLNPRYHLHLLDQFVNEKDLHQQVTNAYVTYQGIKKSLEEAMNADYNEDDLEFLKFQIQEIEDANLTEEEIEVLENELKELQSYEKISTHLSQAIFYMDGENLAKDSLYEGCKELDSLNDFNQIREIKDELYNLYYTLNEKIDDLNHILNHQEYDENRVNEIQERLFLINKIKRKYGGSLLSVQLKADEINNRIEQIEHRQEFLEKETLKLNEAKANYLKLAKALSLIRHQKSEVLSKQILDELKDLQLNHAQFVIDFKENETKDGIDQVEFLISMNLGEALKPLSTTASGGELSRFMLGLKTIFTSLQGIDTIIFDEIDSGVSGSVALAIGKKMQKLATTTQVFCVTHLASVAACANQHYLVKKEAINQKTSTSIKELTKEERIHELAFIANGSTSTSSMQAASELFERAQVKED